uniref:Si:dkey-17e16.9 n=1 Tax=Amphilophus citrinellus TaxID=61819 RepID=A0A3Q0RJV7_AMPCI
MAEYKLEVTTGDMKHAGTMDNIYIILFGTEGQSDRTKLDNPGAYTIKTNLSLGKLLLVKVEKDPFLRLSEDEWYCSKILVTTPEGEVILFPCYRWIAKGTLVELRGGRGLWEITDEKLPHNSHYKDVSEFPAEQRFSMAKSSEIFHTKRMIKVSILFLFFVISDYGTNCICLFLSVYVMQHWKDDDFFGFQFLNAINPNGIKRCSELPPNFPVTEEMVKQFLRDGSSLKQEMERGNIFICDQKIMDGIPTRMYDGQPLHMTAGLCLFYMNPENKLMPIAIQLHQQPSEQNPIFLPSDPEADWLLAKLFIKSGDLMEHQAVYHLLGTHYLAEVFAIATFRSFPVIHPLYKLLISHFRYTLHINNGARNTLLAPDGPLSTVCIHISQHSHELMRRGLSRMTYSSLCLPENITARGLESIPNFYYRDDGLKLWNIINSFVKYLVEYYYPSDSDVCKDTELQEWINEIYTHGFLGNKLSGSPACFNTVEEVIKFITMVIFTVSVQHAAVNNGQFDYSSWVPSGSLLLRKPAPTTKGQSSMKTILETLPNIGETVKFAGMLWLLSDKYTDAVLLGQYPEEQFDEPAPKQMIKEFQAELSYLSQEITARNSQLEVPYTYLNPTEIESSITI